MEYGFLATMGGFKVTVDQQHDPWILCNGATLTPLEVICAEKMKLLPDLTKQMVINKSKMDYLAKGFLIVQGIWFLIQIISRWTAHLPVTFLELNTLAHTICALGLWGFWWRHKPKDVNEPVMITITKYQAAYLSHDCRFNRLEQPVVEQREDLRAGYGEWKSYIPVAQEQKAQEQEAQEQESQEQEAQEQEAQNVLRRVPGPTDPKIGGWEALTEYQKIRRIDKAFKRDGKFMLIPGEETEYYRWESDQPIHLNEAMIKKLKRLPGIENDNEYSKLTESPGMSDFVRFPNCHNLYLTHEVSNTPDPKLLDRRSDKHFKFVLPLVIVYSGVHAASWNSQFPTTIERLLWRIAIVAITGGSLCIWGLFKFSAKFAKDSVGRSWIASVMGVIGFVIVVMRLYFVVEAFASFRSLPFTAYDTVGWINSVPLPHIA
jgi:hypothetical protein